MVPLVQRGMSPFPKKCHFKFGTVIAVKSASLSTVSPSTAMATLSKNLAAIQVDVAPVLLSSVHINNLYGAGDIAAALNAAANVDRNASITKKVDATMLLRAFARPDPEVVLDYGAFFGWEPGGYVLYIRRPIRTSRGDAGILAIGRFSSTDSQSASIL